MQNWTRCFIFYNRPSLGRSVGLAVKLCRVAWSSLVSYLLRRNSIFFPNPPFFFLSFIPRALETLFFNLYFWVGWVFLAEKKGMVVVFYVCLFAKLSASGLKPKPSLWSHF